MADTTWKELQARQRAKRAAWFAAELMKLDGNVCALSRATGINRTDLYKVLRRHGVSPVRSDGRRFGHRGNAAWHSLGEMQ